MNKQRPFIITFIGYGNILAALLLILSLFPKLAEGTGFYFIPLPDYLKNPIFSEDLIRVSISIFFLILAYGFLQLKKWGYWLMVGINAYFLLEWLIADQLGKQHFYYKNPISLMIGLIFIVPTIKYFSKKQTNNTNII